MYRRCYWKYLPIPDARIYSFMYIYIHKYWRYIDFEIGICAPNFTVLSNPTSPCTKYQRCCWSITRAIYIYSVDNKDCSLNSLSLYFGDIRFNKRSFFRHRLFKMYIIFKTILFVYFRIFNLTFQILSYRRFSRNEMYTARKVH